MREEIQQRLAMAMAIADDPATVFCVQPFASVDCETVRPHALSVINQCLSYRLAGENLLEVFPQLQWPLPTQMKLARHVASLSLEVLHHESRNPDYELSR